jgi:hypothetical protein
MGKKAAAARRAARAAKGKTLFNEAHGVDCSDVSELGSCKPDSGAWVDRLGAATTLADEGLAEDASMEFTQSRLEGAQSSIKSFEEQ